MRTLFWSTIAVASLAVMTPACGGGAGATSPIDAGAPDSGMCQWPASLDVTDAGLGALGSGVCTGHRWFLVCTGADGGGGSCIGDTDPPAACPGFVAGECQPRCAAGQYTALCQAFDALPPVSGCDQGIRNPEQTFFCCACP
jgi:hypothetical protein